MVVFGERGNWLACSWWDANKELQADVFPAQVLTEKPSTEWVSETPSIR